MSGTLEQPCERENVAVAYACGDLGAEEMLVFESHLGHCEACRDQVAELRGTRMLFGEIALRRRLQVERARRAVAAQVGASAAPSFGLLAALERGLEAVEHRAESARDAARALSLREWGRRLAAHARQAAEKLSCAVAEVNPFQSASVEVLRDIGWAWVERIEPMAVRGGLVRDGSAARPARQAAPVPSGVELRLEPVPGTTDIELIARGLPPGADRLLVLLIPINAPDQAQCAVLRRLAPTHAEWTARFRNVPPGEYALAIEPLLNRDPG